MVYCNFANSRNAGPHSVVGLLFRFQRPSTTLGFEMLPSSPSLERTRSPKDSVPRQVGEWIYFHFPASSRRPFRLRLRDCGEDTSTSPPCFPSRGLPSRSRVPAFLVEWAVLLRSLTCAVKRRTGRPCCPSSGCYFPLKGRCFYPFVTAPVNFRLSVERSGSPRPFVARGAASTPPPTAPSTAGFRSNIQVRLGLRCSGAQLLPLRRRSRQERKTEKLSLLRVALRRRGAWCTSAAGASQARHGASAPAPSALSGASAAGRRARAGAGPPPAERPRRHALRGAPARAPRSPRAGAARPGGRR
jgi:hypothetical protein